MLPDTMSAGSAQGCGFIDGCCTGRSVHGSCAFHESGQFPDGPGSAASPPCAPQDTEGSQHFLLCKCKIGIYVIFKSNSWKVTIGGRCWSWVSVSWLRNTTLIPAFPVREWQEHSSHRLLQMQKSSVNIILLWIPSQCSNLIVFILFWKIAFISVALPL